MSITSDIRAYADTAIEQGRTQITNVASDVTQRVGDLRAQAEKTLNLDAVKSAVEPYLAQANEYRAAVTDRATGLLDTVTSDKRVAKIVDTAETISATVVGTVTERVVKPVQNLTGRGAKPAARKPAARKSTPRSTTARKPAAKKTTKPAATRPAPKPTAAKSTTRKAPAKKATSSSSTSKA